MMKFLLANVVCWTAANAQYLRGQQQGAAPKVPAYRRLTGCEFCKYEECTEEDGECEVCEQTVDTSTCTKCTVPKKDTCKTCKHTTDTSTCMECTVKKQGSCKTYKTLKCNPWKRKTWRNCIGNIWKRAGKKVCTAYKTVEKTATGAACDVPGAVCKVYKTTTNTIKDAACTGAGKVCEGFNYVTKEVTGAACSASDAVCSAYEPATTEIEDALCKAANEVCKSYKTITNCVEKVGGTTACNRKGAVCVRNNIIVTVAQAFDNFGTCMDDARSDTQMQSCLRDPLPGISCYVNNNGDSFSDGFAAGCALPTLSAGVEFGSLTDQDTDTAVLRIMQADLPLFRQQWTDSPLKDYLHIDATTSFSFADNAELTFNGDESWALTVPGVAWNFDMAVTLKANRESDPCADDPTKCRVVLNKGNTKLVNKVFVAGPVPVHVLVEVQVYLQATPTMAGEIANTLHVSLADGGVDLLRTVTLDLGDSDPADVLSAMKVDSDDLQRKLVDKLIVKVAGVTGAAASIEMCMGVEVGFSLNGIGTTMDVPVCVTAVFQAGGVTIIQNKLDMDFALSLPDPNYVVDTACSFVQMAPPNVVTCSIPGVSCFTNLVDDVCGGVSHELAVLDLDMHIGTLHLLEEKVLYKWSTGLVELSGGNDNNAINLQVCTGECDSDDQCAKGLKCFQRSKGETIPGCMGKGGGKNWDYCYDPSS